MVQCVYRLLLRECQLCCVKLVLSSFYPCVSLCMFFFMDNYWSTNDNLVGMCYGKPTKWLGFDDIWPWLFRARWPSTHCMKDTDLPCSSYCEGEYISLRQGVLENVSGDNIDGSTQVWPFVELLLAVSVVNVDVYACVCASARPLLYSRHAGPSLADRSNAGSSMRGWWWPSLACIMT